MLIDLVTKIMEYSPQRRISAAEALKHPYFDELRELDQQDEDYLKKMKVKMVPQMFDYTEDEIALFGKPKPQVDVKVPERTPSSSLKEQYSRNSYERDGKVQGLNRVNVNHLKTESNHRDYERSHLRTNTEMSYKPSQGYGLYYRDYTEDSNLNNREEYSGYDRRSFP